MYLVCFENMMYPLVRLGLVDIVNVDVHDLEASDQGRIQDFDFFLPPGKTASPTTALTKHMTTSLY